MQRGNEVGGLVGGVGVLTPDAYVSGSGHRPAVLDLADFRPIPAGEHGKVPPGETSFLADLTQAVTKGLFGGVDAG